jgi:hypothetical protein
MPPDVLGRVLLVVWTGWAVFELWLFARGYRRNWRRRQRLLEQWRAGDPVHPGRLILARSRLRRDAVYFLIALVALVIAVASMVGQPGLVGPLIGIGLTLILAVIGVEGHLAQSDDRAVERWNAPRDPPAEGAR